jgi:L-2-hydroxyglutarate oxidase LhgO
MTDHVDCVVAGAGVIGLCIARRLALAGREVLVLEAQGAIGTGTSSRNSEVIHAGIYYPEGTLKARLCVDGRRQLYDYCAAHGVPARRIGKLIVATHEDQLPQLHALRRLGAANGADDLELIDAAACARMEPELFAVAALVSPSTGIIDSHALMLAYQGDAEAAGAIVVLGAPILKGDVTPSGFLLSVGGSDPIELTCRSFINAAGLSAPGLARHLTGVPATSIPPAFLCKGSYYTLTGRSPFQRLIYPMPEGTGMGVHLTLDLGGQARFGPDVEWVEHENYDVDIARAAGFYAAIRRYWPGLPDGALQPGYAGIRPKIAGPGEPPADFMVAGPETHGVSGLINLFGIESPGLTASLAIADHIAHLAGIDANRGLARS